MDSTTKLQTILKTTDESHWGFNAEFDLEYPNDLHDNHKDLLVAPKKNAKPFWLSEYQFEILLDIKLKYKFRKKKRWQTLYNKECYTLHYITLKLHVVLGLKLKKFIVVSNLPEAN